MSDHQNQEEVQLATATSGTYEVVYVESRSTFQAIETNIQLSTPPTVEMIRANNANRPFVYSGGMVAACSIPKSSERNSTYSRGVIPHGKGKMIFEDSGEAYEGEWVFGKREGKGIWRGAKSSANNNNNQKNNNNNNNNSNNTGDNNNNNAENNNNNINSSSSPGSAHHLVNPPPDRPNYEGEWRNDKKHGKGTEQYSDGRIYQGDFREGTCSGTGSMSFPNGDVYRGQFAEGAPHDPRGEYTFTNGDQLVGPWVEGKRHGTFAVSYASSIQHTYQGSFMNDQSMGVVFIS